jgi:hypothetical protein
VKPSGAPRLPMRVLIYLSSLGDVKASWWNIQHDLFYLEGCWPFQLNVAFTNYCSLWCSSSNFIISPQKIQSNLMRCGQVENIYEMKFLIYNTKFSKETTIIFYIYIYIYRGLYTITNIQCTTHNHTPILGKHVYIYQVKCLALSS